MEAPLYTIVENAGLEGPVIVDQVKKSEPGMGFDASSETFVDMMKQGIIDPVKVTKNALTNAVSVAATRFSTTEAAVADTKDNTPAPQPQPEMY